MSIEVNGIAHIQMTVNNIEECMALLGKAVSFPQDENTDKERLNSLLHWQSHRVILIREAPKDKKDVSFDQDTSGLHHFWL